MNILILEPYLTGSHAAWAKGYAKHSRHDIEILSMKGSYWKWRMHGGAVTLAKKFLEMNYQPDVLLATDMLDLTTFLSLTREKTHHIPATVYFHENQLSYPWSPKDRDVIKNRNKHYGFINYVSALTADAVFFNSQYHSEAFFEELWRLLKHFPDYNETGSIEKIKAKSRVLPLGLDLKLLDEYKPATESFGNKKPLILWNHRWEYDKNPEDFFNALYILAERGLDFEVAILGENFSQKPEEFIEAKAKLKNRIECWGYEKDFSIYANWLWKSDIIPVTSKQDFFGVSFVQAIYCNCFPILPQRLSFPEIIPEEYHPAYFYNDFEGLVKHLERAITNIENTRTQNLRRFAQKYNWGNMAGKYDEILEKIEK